VVYTIIPQNTPDCYIESTQNKLLMFIITLNRIPEANELQACGWVIQRIWKGWREYMVNIFSLLHLF